MPCANSREGRRGVRHVAQCTSHLSLPSPWSARLQCAKSGDEAPLSKHVNIPVMDVMYEFHTSMMSIDSRLCKKISIETSAQLCQVDSTLHSI